MSSELLFHAGFSYYCYSAREGDQINLRFLKDPLFVIRISKYVC